MEINLVGDKNSCISSVSVVPRAAGSHVNNYVVFGVKSGYCVYRACSDIIRGSILASLAVNV